MHHPGGWWLSVLVGLVVMAGGCASAGGDGLSDEAGSALAGHMADVREAVDAGEPAAAQQALDALRAEARTRAEAGEVSSQRLAAIGTAVDNVESFLDELETEPAQEPTSGPDPEPDEDTDEDEEAEEEEDEGEDEGEDKDKEEDKEKEKEKEKENNGNGNGNNGEGPGAGKDNADEEDGE